MSYLRFPAILLVSLFIVHFSWSPCNADPLPAAGVVTLTILHDNDLHGHLLPFAYTELGKSALEQPSRGGAARRATYVRRLRSEIKNPTFLVDSGDIATRGPLTTTYKGLADVAAMNAIGYDLAAVGNNEFKLEDGVDATDFVGAQSALLQVIKLSKFPWICANATDQNGAILPGVQPYLVYNFDGVRVGFLGLTTERSANYPQTKGWTIEDPVDAAKKWIPEARNHCDILIAITHIGTTEDERLAAQTTGLDFIIGGDSHTFLYTPVVVKNLDEVGVPIVQDGEFGADLGRLDLKLVVDGLGKWHIGSYHDELLPIDGRTSEALDVKSVLAPYVRPFQITVGHLNAIASSPGGRVAQTTHVIVDAMRKETHSVYALNPLGDGLFEVFRHNAVTRYDVYAALPFHDSVLTAKLTGAELSALLTANPGTVIAGNPSAIVSGQTYQVAFDDYVASSVYKIPASRLRQAASDDRQLVIAYFRQGQPSVPDDLP